MGDLMTHEVDVVSPYMAPDGPVPVPDLAIPGLDDAFNVTKTCEACSESPAIVVCGNCGVYLCRLCLVRVPHDITHKLNPIGWPTGRCVKQRQYVAEHHTKPGFDEDNFVPISSQVLKGATETSQLEPMEVPAQVAEATHACGECGFKLIPPNSHEHDGHNNLLSVDDAADTVRSELEDFLRDGLVSINRLENATFRANELKLGTRLKEIRLVGNLDQSLELLNYLMDAKVRQIKLAGERQKGTIGKCMDDCISILHGQGDSIRQRIAAFERILELGQSHPMAGINGFARATAVENNIATQGSNKNQLEHLNRLIAFEQQKAKQFIEQLHVHAQDVETAVASFLIQTDFKKEHLSEHHAVNQNTDLVSLRSAQMLQDVTGLPVEPRTRTVQSTVPYWSLNIPPDVSGLLFRVDTFHPQWELVRVSLYHGSYLAIFRLERDAEKQESLNPFYVRASGDMASVDLNHQRVDKAPECVIPLAECTLQRLDNAEGVSPIGKLLNRPDRFGLELMRYRFNVPLTYWILASDNESVISSWQHELSAAMRHNPLDIPPTDKNTPFTPSTNPALRPSELGINIPPSGTRWATMHATAAARKAKQTDTMTEEEESSSSEQEEVTSSEEEEEVTSSD